jgi:hypothetical protein
LQTLVRNELRERVVVRVDGGIRNGRDILVGDPCSRSVLVCMYYMTCCFGAQLSRFIQFSMQIFMLMCRMCIQELGIFDI